MQGDPVAIDGIRMSPATLLTELNKLGGDNGAPTCILTQPDVPGDIKEAHRLIASRIS